MSERFTDDSDCDMGGCTVSQAPPISRISQDVAISYSLMLLLLLLLLM